MTIVELRRRRPEDASVETLARIYAPDPDGPAVIEPVDPADREWVEFILSSAGVTGSRGRSLSLADGEAYVRALPQSFRGSRLWAEEIAEDPNA